MARDPIPRRLLLHSIGGGSQRRQSGREAFAFLSLLKLERLILGQFNLAKWQLAPAVPNVHAGLLPLNSCIVTKYNAGNHFARPVVGAQKGDFRRQKLRMVLLSSQLATVAGSHWVEFISAEEISPPNI
eukprot:scaffold47888_cov22-Prasinocladus_malaysianus.AAC.1